MSGGSGGGGNGGRSGGGGQLSEMESYADTATKERLLIIDGSGKTIKDAGGSKNAVIWSASDAPNNRGQYTFIHNHLSSESGFPSQADIRTGAKMGGTHIITSPKTTITMKFGKPGSTKLSKPGKDLSEIYSDRTRSSGIRGNNIAAAELKRAAKEFNFRATIKER